MPRPTDDPIAWATDTNFASGPRLGSPTKNTSLSTAAAAQGQVAGLSYNADNDNQVLNNFYQWLDYLRTDASSGKFGDGSDGAATITGGTTTLTRDMYYTSLAVSSTGILITNGFRIFATEFVETQAGGVIHNDGADGEDDAQSALGGVGAAAGSLGAGFDGATAPGGQIAGVAGTAATDSAGAAGGDGGDGEDSGTTTRAGGAGGTATEPTATAGGFRHTQAAFGTIHAATEALLRGGAGGGSGGSEGGGGGGGGGVISIWTPELVVNGEIRAAGGAGGDGYTGPDALGNGGGGGGGGGAVFIVTRDQSGVGTITAPGGAGGTGFDGGGTFQDGDAGSAGNVLIFEG